MALPKPEPITRNCLRCRKSFRAWDRRMNWICPGCDRANSKEFLPRTVSSTVYPSESGINVSSSDDR